MFANPNNVPRFRTPYTSAVNEAVNGTVASHDIPPITANVHIAIGPGNTNSDMKATALTRYTAPSKFFLCHRSDSIPIASTPAALTPPRGGCNSRAP